LQLGRLAAAVEEPAEPDELPSPVEVDPEAPPVPLAPALPEEPRVPDEPLEPDPIEPELAPRLDDPEEPAPLLAEPTVLLPELDPELEPRLEEEPELFIALFSWMLPCASRQCVAADTFGVAVAPDVPLIESELDCAEAANAPHAISDDASSAVFKKFIFYLLGIPLLLNRYAHQPFPELQLNLLKQVHPSATTFIRVDCANNPNRLFDRVSAYSPREAGNCP
jgi:hypothetical protein